MKTSVEFEMMTIAWLVVAVGMTAAAPRSFGAADFGAQREQVLALGKLTKAPAVTPAAGFTADGDRKAVYFDGLPWNGRPTKVFAWLGLPAKRTGKVPGIVLVHGGGGTAFKDWVKKWNDRGFAAISIAVEGQTDDKAPKDLPGATATGWRRHEWAGPERNGIYGDSAASTKTRRRSSSGAG